MRDSPEFAAAQPAKFGLRQDLSECVRILQRRIDGWHLVHILDGILPCTFSFNLNGAQRSKPSHLDVRIAEAFNWTLQSWGQ